MALPATTYDTATLVNPGSSLTDFTLIVDLSRMSAAWWTAVDTSDGTKGRAAKDSGPTELACDWVAFDSVNETGLLRVKWSGTLATSGSQTLRIYPPQAANASVSAADTYGSDNAYGSQVKGYWPLNTLSDRTSNGNDLTANNTAAAGVGETLYNGGLLSGEMFTSTDMFYGSIPALTGTDEYCFMAWVHPDTDTSGGFSGIVHLRDAASDYVSLVTDSSGKPRCREYAGSFSFFGETPTTGISPLTANTWQHLMGYKNGDSYRDVFVDGTVGVANTSLADSNVDEVFIGNQSLGAYWPYDGCMAEVMILTGGSYQGQYEYEQSSDQATFWGTWTNVPVAAGISIPVVMHHRRMMGVS